MAAAATTIITTNPWVWSLAVSVVYVGIFGFYSSRPITNETNHNGYGLLFGFCVAGYPKSPNRSEGCHSDWRNSHVASFVVDTAMGLLVYVLYRRLKRRVDDEAVAVGSTKASLLNPKITAYFACMAIIILLHGFLHLVLSEMMNCYVAPTTIPWWILTLGRFVLGSFSFLLCFVILAICHVVQDGTTTTAAITNLGTRVVLPSLLLSVFVVYQSLGTGVEWLLPALFAVSHPLSCLAALFSQSPIFTHRLGWAFLITTVMGILELTSCPTLYRSLGGHVWYDVWLHVAVLLSLPPFAPPIANLTVEKRLVVGDGGLHTD